MTISSTLREQVRQRAIFACEYCGVTETDAGGSLTIDHFHPVSEGGSDDSTNLIYCCNRCNEYKAAYWPRTANSPSLWNPRQEAANIHFVVLANGSVHAITDAGHFTLQHLRLNRAALIAHRMQKRQREQELRLLIMYRDIVASLQQLRRHEAELIQEQRVLLEEQRRALRLLLEEQE